jgi:hypothetical protein
MKRRQGFVSNSSSSSFIINVGVVTDEIKFQKLLKRFDMDLNKYDFTIIRGIKDFKENHDGKWGSPFDQGDFAGNYCTLSDFQHIWDKNPMATIIVKTEYGDEGDGAFYEEGDWECDYSNIDLSYFSELDQFLYTEANSNEHGIYIVHQHYGGGRNG